MYTDKLLEEFYNPSNVGVIKGATSVGKVKDKACGDIVKIYAAIEGDTVTEASFQVYGNPVTIACASVATKLMTGKNFDELYSITVDTLKRELGGKIPTSKNYSILLVEDAIRDCLDSFFIKTQGAVPEKYKAIRIASNDNAEIEEAEVEEKPEPKPAKIKKEKPAKKVKIKDTDLDEDDLDGDDDLSDELKAEAENLEKEEAEKPLMVKTNAPMGAESETNASVGGAKTKRTVTKTLEVFTRNIDEDQDEDAIFNSIDNLKSTISGALKKLNDEGQN